MSAERDFRHAALRQERCAGCGRLILRPQDGEAHHAITRYTLEKLFPDRPELVWDIRNAVLLCRVSCHPRHHVRFEPLSYERLPRDVHDFAAELGLVWWVEKVYPRHDRGVCPHCESGEVVGNDEPFHCPRCGASWYGVRSVAA